MRRYDTLFARWPILILFMLCLTGCDLNTWIEEHWPQESEDEQVVKLTLAVAPHIAWMPWFLANEEGTFHDYVATHNIDVQFITDTYQNAIDKFVEGEIQAIAITNIDAIAQLVRRNVEADVILIASYSYGNEAILLPADADPNILKIRGKTFALAQFSSRHYLLDRFLVRNQIPFEEVKVLDTPEVDIPDFLLGGKVYGVVTSNPYLDKLTGESRAKVLFDSRQIPNEIVDLIVVHRDTLLDYPAFAQVLLGSWFSVMEKLQGNRKGSTLDAMARLAGVSREDFERQIAAILLNDTPTKALSAIRDRRMRKTMRHVRYFIERHQLANEEPFINWVSYPGRTQALLHFNGQPLQDFVAPPKIEDF